MFFLVPPTYASLKPLVYRYRDTGFGGRRVAIGGLTAGPLQKRQTERGIFDKDVRGRARDLGQRMGETPGYGKRTPRKRRGVGSAEEASGLLTPDVG